MLWVAPLSVINAVCWVFVWLMRFLITPEHIWCLLSSECRNLFILQPPPGFAPPSSNFSAFCGAAGHSDPCDWKGMVRSEVQKAVCHQPITRGLSEPRLQRRKQRGAGGLAGRSPPAPLRSEWVRFSKRCGCVWEHVCTEQKARRRMFWKSRVGRWVDR